MFIYHYSYSFYWNHFLLHFFRSLEITTKSKDKNNFNFVSVNKAAGELQLPEVKMHITRFGTESLQLSRYKTTDLGLNRAIRSRYVRE